MIKATWKHQKVASGFSHRLELLASDSFSSFGWRVLRKFNSSTHFGPFSSHLLFTVHCRDTSPHLLSSPPMWHWDDYGTFIHTVCSFGFPQGCGCWTCKNLNGCLTWSVLRWTCLGKVRLTNIRCLKETPPSFDYSEAQPAARYERWRILAAAVHQRFSFEVKMCHRTNILHLSAVILCWSWIYRKQTEAARSNFLIAGNTRANQFRNHYSITGWGQTQACVTSKKQKELDHKWTSFHLSFAHSSLYTCLSHKWSSRTEWIEPDRVENSRRWRTWEQRN